MKRVEYKQLNVSKEHFLIDLTLVHLTKKRGESISIWLIFLLIS